MKIIALCMIKFYQRYLSFMLGKNCKHIPTCSQYTYQAISRYGILKGTWLGIKRILTCNIFFAPRVDEVP